MKKIQKFNLKSFITGFLAATLISTLCIPALASYITKTITVQTGINVYNNGQFLNLTDANGNKVEPFIYNGSTYLPVRAIADVIGKEISWDDATSSVYIGTNEGTYIKPNVIKNDSNNGKSVMVYPDYWNLNSPFKVNRNEISTNAFGVRFMEDADNACAYFLIDNSNLNYKKITWYVADDDISKRDVSTVAVGVTADNTSEIISDITKEKQGNGLIKYTADISNMQKIAVYILPSFSQPYDLRINTASNEASPLNLNSLGRMSQETYAVVVGPYVK